MLYEDRNFRNFRSFSGKFMPVEIINQQNAEVFSREIVDIFQDAKVFSPHKKK